eukprot:441401-Pelagomonas_calceolata.AAC.2
MAARHALYLQTPEEPRRFLGEGVSGRMAVQNGRRRFLTARSMADNPFGCKVITVQYGMHAVEHTPPPARNMLVGSSLSKRGCSPA